MQKIDSSSDDPDPQQTQAVPEQMRIDFDYVPTWWSSQRVADLLCRLGKTSEVTLSTPEQSVQAAIDVSLTQPSRSSAGTLQRRDAEIDRFEEAEDKAAYEKLVSGKEEHNKKRA